MEFHHVRESNRRTSWIIVEFIYTHLIIANFIYSYLSAATAVTCGLLLAEPFCVLWLQFINEFPQISTVSTGITT